MGHSKVQTEELFKAVLTSTIMTDNYLIKYLTILDSNVEKMIRINTEMSKNRMLEKP